MLASFLPTFLHLYFISFNIHFSLTAYSAHSPMSCCCRQNNHTHPHLHMPHPHPYIYHTHLCHSPTHHTQRYHIPTHHTQMCHTPTHSTHMCHTPTHLAGVFIGHQDVPCCQVPVDESLVGKILHPSGNLASKVEKRPLCAVLVFSAEPSGATHRRICTMFITLYWNATAKH